MYFLLLPFYISLFNSEFTDFFLFVSNLRVYLLGGDKYAFEKLSPVFHVLLFQDFRKHYWSAASSSSCISRSSWVAKLHFYKYIYNLSGSYIYILHQKPVQNTWNL